MKTFLAIYVGTASGLEKSGWSSLSEGERKARQATGMKAWMDWGQRHHGAIVEQGSPLGKTKRAGPDGVSDITNAMAGYVIVQAESHDDAVRMFEGHPHFTTFPGDSVEVMECLPIPKR